MTVVKICLNKMIGRCPDCMVDLDRFHHPNNRDCPRYKEKCLVVYEVKERKVGPNGKGPVC